MNNNIYIHSHDMGRCIKPYGYPVPTPHLMKLAENGTLFRQAYCAAPNHIDKGLSRQFVYDHGCLDTIPDEEELYDLYFDPQEQKNLNNHTKYANDQ